MLPVVFPARQQKYVPLNSVDWRGGIRFSQSVRFQHGDESHKESGSLRSIDRDKRKELNTSLDRLVTLQKMCNNVFVQVLLQN